MLLQATSFLLQLEAKTVNLNRFEFRSLFESSNVLISSPNDYVFIIC